MPETLSFHLDGRAVDVAADPKSPALSVLRDILGVRGCKAGCSPQGFCGCCAVLVDGRPRLTCTLPARSLAGKVVTTLDGVPDADRALLADSFVRAGAVQCGYCTPGIALSAWSLLQGETSPSREAIDRALTVHVCRCTGYEPIRVAVEAAAAVRRGEPNPLPPADRPEGAAIVVGDRPYVDDLVRPGMIHGAVVLAGAARGRIRAVTLPAGVPGAVLLEPGSELPHAGAIVAVVGGEDAAEARRRAAEAVVEVDEEPPLPDAAVARARMTDGHVAAALAGCVHRVELEVALAPTDPIFLEPEAALAVPVPGADGGEILVYSPGHDAAAEAASLADLGRVRVRLVPSGGSYGGKEGLAIPRAAVRLAQATGRPARVAVTLEQGMRLHPRRAAASAKGRAGCGADGTGLVLELAVRFDGGAHAGGADELVSRAIGAVAYDTAALAVDAEVVTSGSAPTGLVRGAGGLATSFLVERLLDALATEAGIDPLALRLTNTSGDTRRVLDALAPRWAGATGPRGVAIGRVDATTGARVVLTVTGPDAVEVQCNVPDLGQGRDETLLRALTDVTGLPASVFEVVWGESEVVGTGAPASAPVGEAARRAAAAMVAAGGALAGLVGQRFVGEDRERGPAGLAAVLAELEEGGATRRLTVAVGAGAQDPALAARLAEGAAHMGMGVALTEEVAHQDGIPDGRFRVLGVMKARVSPPIAAEIVPLDGGPREVAEAVILGVPGALAGAIDPTGARRQLPMKDSSTARAAGARPARG
jgi:xanthine dehydrogenase molybdenum-binding subunit